MTIAPATQATWIDIFQKSFISAAMMSPVAVVTERLMSSGGAPNLCAHKAGEACVAPCPPSTRTCSQWMPSRSRRSRVNEATCMGIPVAVRPETCEETRDTGTDTLGILLRGLSGLGQPDEIAAHLPEPRRGGLVIVALRGTSRPAVDEVLSGDSLEARSGRHAD